VVASGRSDSSGRSRRRWGRRDARARASRQVGGVEMAAVSAARDAEAALEGGAEQEEGKRKGHHGS
jgi:hypothetical protein